MVARPRWGSLERAVCTDLLGHREDGEVHSRTSIAERGWKPNQAAARHVRAHSGCSGDDLTIGGLRLEADVKLTP